MPKRYYYKTPLGDFASSAQAAAAHKCDKSTILNRCLTHPDQYQKTERPEQAAEPKVKVSWSQTAKVMWPLTWAQYKGLSFEIKEEIWLKFCAGKNKNPDLDSTVDEFFDEMDRTQDIQNTQEQQDDQEQVV